MNNSQSDIFDDLSANGKDQQVLGRVLVKLEGRLESIEIKVMSLTKVVRLLQQYSEKKDIQYQKQSHNIQLVESKLSKIDAIQLRFQDASKKYDQLSLAFKAQCSRMQLLNKALQDRNVEFQSMQQKLNLAIEQVNRKVDGIESTMLQSLREVSKNKKCISQANYNTQSYTLDELNYKISHLQAKLKTETQKLKVKLEKLISKNAKGALREQDSYGLGIEKNRKSRGKGSFREKQYSPLRRLRSK